MCPIIANESGSERASWIHRASGERNSSQVSQSDSQSNSQWSNVPRVRLVLVADSENAEDQNEAEEELETKGLIDGDAGLWVESGVTKSIGRINKHPQRGSSSNGASTLSEDVENSTDDANFASDQKAASDCRINVTP